MSTLYVTRKREIYRSPTLFPCTTFYAMVLPKLLGEKTYVHAEHSLTAVESIPAHLLAMPCVAIIIIG